MKKALILGSWMLAAPFAATAADEPPPAFNLILEGTFPEATLVHVSIEGGKESVEYALPLTQARLLSGVRSPVAETRDIKVWAEDARGERLFEGAASLAGDAGFDTPAVLELKSALDGSTAELTLASQRVALEFAAVSRGDKIVTRVTANVFDADGRRLSDPGKDLDWKFEEPWVRDLLLPCKEGGGWSLCAEFDARNFIKGDRKFVACYRDRICHIEFVPAPTPVWQKISVGLEAHVCAIKRDGTAWCWGRGKEGQLGTPAPDLCADGASAPLVGCSAVPVQVQCAGGACNFIDISAGKQHTCAVDTNHDAWCWGGNGFGEGGRGVRDALPDGRPIPVGSPVPQPVSGGFKFEVIRAGANSTCGLTYVTHQVYCWGTNGSGLVPNIDFDLNKRPMRVAVPADTVALDLRESHACVKTLQGELWCWGTNFDSQLVSGTGLSFLSSRTCKNCPAAPLRMQDSVAVLAGNRVSGFSTGSFGTCATVNTADTLCWGRPLPGFPAGVDVERLSRGFLHYCTITRGDLRCAGNGALGDGNPGANSNAGPVRVSSPLHFREIDAGRESSCGIGYDELLYCWGDNSFGKLGNGAATGAALLPAPIFMLQSLTVP